MEHTIEDWITFSEKWSKLTSRPNAQPHGKKCTHCGNTEHIREICSKLHVFQDWGHELWHKKMEATTTDEGT